MLSQHVLLQQTPGMAMSAHRNAWAQVPVLLQVSGGMRRLKWLGSSHPRGRSELSSCFGPQHRQAFGEWTSAWEHSSSLLLTLSSCVLALNNSIMSFWNNSYLQNVIPKQIFRTLRKFKGTATAFLSVLYHLPPRLPITCQPRQPRESRAVNLARAWGTLTVHVSRGVPRAT